MDQKREPLHWPEGFEEVWRRVQAQRGAQAAAQRCGVKLMPRRGGRGLYGCQKKK